jgi:quercetin dioxygenase-like cupin family protein
MTIKTRLLIGAAVVTICIVGIALATPVVGLNFANILASGTSNTEISVHVRVALPPVAGHEQEDNEWTAKLLTSGPSNFIVQDVSYLPGGHTGWHSHPGFLLVSVTEGSIEWYDANCQRTVYNVGDSFTESTATHFVRNVGSVNARFMVTYVLANGQPRRIDQPAPACAAALGLD